MEEVENTGKSVRGEASIKRPINQRIKHIIKVLHISQNQFAKQIGISSTLISQITSERNNFGVDVLQRIVGRYPELNYDWLLTGRGPIFLKTDISSKDYIDSSKSDFFTHDIQSEYIKGKKVNDFHDEVKYIQNQISLLSYNMNDLRKKVDKLETEKVKSK